MFLRPARDLHDRWRYLLPWKNKVSKSIRLNLLPILGLYLMIELYGELELNVGERYKCSVL